MSWRGQKFGECLTYSESKLYDFPTAETVLFIL